ncbi:flagellar biosynthetic protein FliO [Paenibacillus sp. MMS20-IR301]|uniref:flagellar biosynthetic protein FliO n=1 Tax=Paenibacillus sp. MMS20-IR301 TaxID=2895946 RepID=UPI0028EC8ED9|nr:flagellar biosynthetic protein FliO [Paenibacillus sp. MMS20-IR301]WNS44800.1 flagellar biosynthetic protein FliO [Paenibacillus sp. MMS20-IR301]
MLATSGTLGAGNPLLSLLKVVFVLAVIVVLIVLLIRFLGRRNQSLMSGRSIRTLGAMGLGPNKSVQVIELGSSLYLIGVGENISMMDKITDPAEVALIISAFEDQASAADNFMTPLIGKIRSRLRGDVPSQEIELNETSSFYETLQSKLALAPERKEMLEELLRDDDDRKKESGDL